MSLCIGLGHKPRTSEGYSRRSNKSLGPVILMPDVSAGATCHDGSHQALEGRRIGRSPQLSSLYGDNTSANKAYDDEQVCLRQAFRESLKKYND